MVAESGYADGRENAMSVSFLPRVAKQQQISTVFAKPTTPTAAHAIMATSPPTAFSNIDENTTRISSWVEKLPPTPPTDEERGRS
jgi:hypothetical protein